MLRHSVVVARYLNNFLFMLNNFYSHEQISVHRISLLFTGTLRTGFAFVYHYEPF